MQSLTCHPRPILLLDYRSPGIRVRTARGWPAASTWAIAGLLGSLVVILSALRDPAVAMGGSVLVAGCGIMTSALAIHGLALAEVGGRRIISIWFLVGTLEWLIPAAIALGAIQRPRGWCPPPQRAEIDIIYIETAIDMFEIDCGRFPLNEEGIDALFSAPPGVKDWKGPYFRKRPIDPWGHPYRYYFPARHEQNDYDLFSLRDDGAVIGNWIPKSVQ